jgi:hypothetical protein
MERSLGIPPDGGPIAPGEAYWRQRTALAAHAGRIRALFEVVESAKELWPYQWAQLLAMTLEFQPDLVIELGRGWGNSTCVFTEAVNQLGADGRRVVSLCLSEGWETRTRERVARLVPPGWFAPLQARRSDILAVDYAALACEAERVLVFWDAHGFDIAECVLGEILPAIADRPHCVLMHDLSDGRWAGPESTHYGTRGLWKGNNWGGPRVRLGSIDSAVEQAVAIVDFMSRNGRTLGSADESIRAVIGTDPARVAEMQRLLGDLFDLQAHWFWFSLNDRAETYTFPRFQWAKAHETRLAGIAEVA